MGTSCQDEPIPADDEGLDTHGRVLELRLAADRIDRGAYQRPYARIGCVRITPVNRHEDRPLAVAWNI